MSRHERVIPLPNLAGGYSLTLSSKDSNTLVIRLVPDEEVDTSGTLGQDTGGGGGWYGYGDVNANDSFDSGYQGYTPPRNRNISRPTYIGFKNGLNNGYYSLPIRKKSKADYADLQEGDRVLSINGKSVRNTARDVAMAYIDETDDSLDLEIVRTRSANPRIQDRQMNQEKQSSVDNSSRSTTWQSTQRQPSSAKQQPIYQQTQPQQRQQPHQARFQLPQQPQPQQARFQLPQQQQPQQKPKSRFEMPKPSTNPRYSAPGPKTDFALQYGKPSPLQKSKKQPTYEPVSIMQSKPSGKAAGVGRELTITFAMPDENTKVDFGSPPQSPSGMSVDSGVPPESPLTPKKHLEEEEEETDVYKDPSIILRSLAKDQPAAERKDRLQRPYSEPAGRVSEDPEPEVSIVEKRRACKTIADLLMFPKNKQAKGARMFAKRRKRSARYTIEATGQKDSDEDSDGSSTGESGAAIITIKAAPPPPPPMSNGVIPIPPPPPPGGFTQRIKVEPTNFNVKLKSKAKCDHTAVSPKQCLVLADGLKSHSGRAAEMFEKRRLRSEQFVLDESTMKHPAPTPFKKPPGPQTSAKPEKKVSPWEAAEKSPFGCITHAFPKKEVKIPPPTQAKPKPVVQPPSDPRIKPGFKANRDFPKYPGSQHVEPVPLKQGPTLPKTNFKDFNVKPRGWGVSSNGDNRSGSPASLNSEGSIGRGQGQTRSLKYSGGFNDFNPKPKSFGFDSPRHGALSPTVSLAESDDL
ncbi:synaptopodin 2-like protein isoform X2 [Lytechinus variegatus]|uniref:synaptopodin 2-like protein isoform X2 n=1 Tax=Lytechinus variegatus TaxID=7654 RepID=UPI001BB1C458|nr:synaptopodin 2-like protein isoform X2 [Lytechinus variegatus]